MQHGRYRKSLSICSLSQPCIAHVYICTLSVATNMHLCTYVDEMDVWIKEWQFLHYVCSLGTGSD